MFDNGMSNSSVIMFLFHLVNVITIEAIYLHILNFHVLAPEQLIN